MSHRHELTLEQFRKIEPHLPGQAGGHGRVAKDNQSFLNAVIYVAKTSIPWRDLPERFGKWDTVFHRFNEWSKKGVWKRLFELMQDPDLEWLFVDSTIVRAHQHAAGMNTGGEDQDLGRSVGGFSTKLHMAVDSLGNPVAMVLSPGQDHDSQHAMDVIGDLKPEVVAMDKAYDSEPLMNELRTRGIEPCIPPKKNRKNPHEYDRHIYKQRSIIERTFNLMKQFRRMATRYEKTSRNYLSFAMLAGMMILLR
jgi:transposase